MDSDTRSPTDTVGRNSVRHWLTIYLKGVAMGAADSVPGVSGGTIAFITGIYERLITAITNIDPTELQLLTRVHTRSGRKQVVTRIVEMDLPFLVVLGLGVVTAVVTVSRIVHAALQQAEAMTFAFFFGLIAASAIVLYEHISVRTPGRLAAAVAGFTIAFFVSGVTSGSDVTHSLPLIFLSGSIAIVAMILPGVSGAFFLVLLGQYEYLTGILTSFVDTVIAVFLDGESIRSLLEPATVVGTFGVGAVIGLFTVAHAIRWALDHYRIATLSFLVSLMVGALRLPVAEVRANTTDLSPETVISLLVAVAVGGGIVLLLERHTDDLDY